jgi:Rrf2 family protein
MNLLSRSTDYAIRALIYMAAHEGELVSTANLNRALGLPRPFMRKILQVLEQAGHVSSVQGHKGGFRLAMAPLKIRLADLMKVFQGDISLGDCLFKKRVCAHRSTCPLRREITDMEQMLLTRLKAVTVADLIRKGA